MGNPVAGNATLWPRRGDGSLIAPPCGSVAAPATSQELHLTARSNHREWGNVLGRFFLQVPAPAAAIRHIVGIDGSQIGLMSRPLPELGLGAANIQRFPARPYMGDVWFLVDAHEFVRARMAARAIEEIIIARQGA